MTPKQKDLEQRIRSAQRQREETETENQARMTKTNHGMRIASEIIMSPVAGGVLGYVIDSFLGTMPAAIIICILLGMAAGFYRAYSLSK